MRQVARQNGKNIEINKGLFALVATHNFTIGKKTKRTMNAKIVDIAKV
jgi:hypothetical protein